MDNIQYQLPILVNIENMSLTKTYFIKCSKYVAILTFSYHNDILSLFSCLTLIKVSDD